MPATSIGKQIPGRRVSARHRRPAQHIIALHVFVFNVGAATRWLARQGFSLTRTRRLAQVHGLRGARGQIVFWRPSKRHVMATVKPSPLADPTFPRYSAPGAYRCRKRHYSPFYNRGRDVGFQDTRIMLCYCLHQLVRVLRHFVRTCREIVLIGFPTNKVDSTARTGTPAHETREISR